VEGSGVVISSLIVDQRRNLLWYLITILELFALRFIVNEYMHITKLNHTDAQCGPSSLAESFVTVFIEWVLYKVPTGIISKVNAEQVTWEADGACFKCTSHMHRHD